MAKREALRELQVRLAQRLQAAQLQGTSVAWLAVRAAGRNYLLPLGHCGEIVALQALQPVPHAVAWFKGVLNVRGSLLGVVDLAAFVANSLGAAVPANNAPASAGVSVVTMNSALGVNCGLQVDSLTGLRGGDAFVSHIPPAADALVFEGASYLDAEGMRWQEINLQALAQSAAFLAIGA